MDAALDGRVLGGQAEGIEADGEEDVVAVHAQEARARVGRRLDVPVADVQVARGVGVHREQVVVGLAVVVEVGVVEPQLLPASLPVGLDGGRVVAVDRCACGVAVRGVGAGHACILTDAGLSGARPGNDKTPAVSTGVRDSRFGWWSDGDSNPGPSACHADALPAELSPRAPHSSESPREGLATDAGLPRTGSRLGLDGGRVQRPAGGRRRGALRPPPTAVSRTRSAAPIVPVVPA